ncbi:alpha-L-fucosidase [Humibacter ginsenosidimutans]|uniref:alpha-L-fucosidase n=1 Tax=Humibacter ginsenosidimutans TaxID=2599293 RepID=UPI001FED8808|nr:alpha-L-fucosidase [Humibacter ginsenosidimutans]
MAEAIPLMYGAQSEGRRDDETMRRFRHDRFGQFIHWGLYSIPAGSWNGVTYDYAAEFLPQSAGIGPARWAGLVDDFAAPEFDPEAWASLAADLGARYVTVTAKHHDGFCLWPSSLTDFTVAATPRGRDVIGELVHAYTARGIAVHLYYSVLDWHHPDWRYAISSSQDEEAFDRYLSYAGEQLRELATRYPNVRGFWFDGTWDESVKANGRWSWEIECMLKRLIPGAIVNSRLRADEHGARHRDSNGALMGDYFSGFERRLPDPWDRTVTAEDWEACVTIPQNSWGYHAGAEVARTHKHPLELLEQLVQAVSLGGNLLLNFGPRGDGSFAPFEKDVVHTLGAWLETNGACIYGCGPADGWDYPGWGYYTADAETGAVYAVVTRIPVSGAIALQLPERTRVRNATAVATGRPVPFAVRDDRTVRFEVDRASVIPLAFALEVEQRDDTAEQPEVNPDLAGI